MDSFTNEQNIQLTEAAYSVLPTVDKLFRSMNSVNLLGEEKCGKGIDYDSEPIKILGT